MQFRVPPPEGLVESARYGRNEGEGQVAAHAAKKEVEADSARSAAKASEAREKAHQN